MRNARKVTRRRSVTSASRPPCSALLVAARRRRLRQQLEQHPARGSSGGAQARRGRLLDPRIRLRGIPRAGLRKDRRRARASASATPSAPPATRAAPSSPASPHRSSTSPRPATWNGWSKKANSSPRTGKSSPTAGIATDSVVVIARQQGQPARDQVLQRPARRTKNAEVVTPNPFSSGSARWNIMAIYGTRDRRRQVARRGAGSGQDGARKDQGPAGQRPRRASPPSARARATSCSPTRTKRSRPKRKAKKSNTSIPPSTIQIETPIAVTKKRAGAGGRRFPQVPLVRRRPGTLG